METKVGRSERVLGKLGIEARAKSGETTQERIERLESSIWQIMMDDDKWKAAEMHVGRMKESLPVIDAVSEQLAQLEVERKTQEEEQKFQQECEKLFHSLSGNRDVRSIDSILGKLEGDPKKAEKIAFVREKITRNMHEKTQLQERYKKGHQLFKKWQAVRGSQSENAIRRQGGLLGVLDLEETREAQETLAQMPKDEGSKEMRDQVKEKLAKIRKQIQRNFEFDAGQFAVHGMEIEAMQKTLDQLA
jgi:hypothetical protein